MLNQAFSLANGETAVIMLDRWCDGSAGNIGVQVDAGSALVEGTLDRINQGETPTWDTVNSQGGATLTALTAYAGLRSSALEAVRITATGATSGRVLQSGD